MASFNGKVPITLAGLTIASVAQLLFDVRLKTKVHRITPKEDLLYMAASADFRKVYFVHYITESSFERMSNQSVTSKICERYAEQNINQAYPILKNQDKFNFSSEFAASVGTLTEPMQVATCIFSARVDALEILISIAENTTK
ncbi:hypothetical protein EDC96DRAFT_566291 [Choanephora cucurbitarum]|nr:hypothetical protein EDC96DRAFT_566291 [Choanephora cucurbitarum]